MINYKIFKRHPQMRWNKSNNRFGIKNMLFCRSTLSEIKRLMQGIKRKISCLPVESHGERMKNEIYGLIYEVENLC